MESLLDTLYAYAQENRYGPLSYEDRVEQEQYTEMILNAMQELTALGYFDLARRIEDGFAFLAWLDQRALFRAGLSIGLELNRL